MADRRALCRDLRLTAAALDVIIDALGDEGNENADWLSCEAMAFAHSLTMYADDIEAEELAK